jgi:hypothetical protein
MCGWKNVANDRCWDLATGCSKVGVRPKADGRVFGTITWVFTPLINPHKVVTIVALYETKNRKTSY